MNPGVLRARLRRELVSHRLAALCVGALCSALALAALGYVDTHAWRPPLAVLGAVLGALVLLAAYPPWADPLRELDRSRDADGLIRAAMAVDPALPQASLLVEEAVARLAARRGGFRPAATLRPFLCFAAAALSLALWAAAGPSGPAARAGAGGGVRGRSAVASGGGIPRGAPAVARGGKADARSAPPRNPRRSETGPPTPRYLPVPPADGPRLRAGRDFGAEQTAVEAYLRLRAAHSR